MKIVPSYPLPRVTGHPRGSMGASTHGLTSNERPSRHAKVETLSVYDDNRQNVQGDLSELLANALEERSNHHRVRLDTPVQKFWINRNLHGLNSSDNS